MTKVLFLDRDGTINIDCGYVHDMINIYEKYTAETLVRLVQMLLEFDDELKMIDIRKGGIRGIWVVSR